MDDPFGFNFPKLPEFNVEDFLMKAKKVVKPKTTFKIFTEEASMDLTFEQASRLSEILTDLVELGANSPAAVRVTTVEIDLMEMEDEKS